MAINVQQETGQPLVIVEKDIALVLRKELKINCNSEKQDLPWSARILTTFHSISFQFPDNRGPVFQSSVTLRSSLRGQLVKCLRPHNQLH